MSTPAPGWYPDPTNPASVRWWDGSKWGEQTQPKQPPVAATPPLQPAPEVPAAAAEAVKVPLFGARSLVRELTVRVRDLEATIARLGGMSLVEIQDEVARLKGVRDELTAANQRDVARHEGEILAAREEIADLNRQLLDVRHAVSLQDVALYDFAHPAESSATLANDLSAVRLAVKQSIKDGTAVSASTTFTYNGSAAKGRTFAKNMAKTMLAAYNAEAENAIKAVKAGGLDTARARLDRVVTRIERNGEMVDLKISPAYHRLRLRELALAERHMQAVQAEREAERERKAELREQQKAEAELRRERERLDKEKAHYLNVIDALRARGDTAEADRIAAQLADVERAIADVDYRAANIRAGYVYVISNVGTMGERVVKIGMTRRLEPMDRVRELGDASVPFPFDVHALFFANDAVAVETMLHQEFADRRVNRINTRREFFYCTPAEVLEKLQSHGVSVVEYTVEPEAEQYRLSQAASV